MARLIEKIDAVQVKINAQKPLRVAVWTTIQEKLRLKWTYDPNALEGSTLTKGETYFFLREGLTVEGKPFKDFLDARNKATDIEKLCNLTIGAARYCSPEITDSFTFYQTPEGFILPKSMVDPGIIDVEFVEGKEAEELERQIAEHQRMIGQKKQEKIERRAEINRKIAQQKREKKRNDNQLGLF